MFKTKLIILALMSTLSFKAQAMWGEVCACGDSSEFSAHAAPPTDAEKRFAEKIRNEKIKECEKIAKSFDALNKKPCDDWTFSKIIKCEEKRLFVTPAMYAKYLERCGKKN